MQGKNKPKIIDFGLIKAIVFICFCDDVRIKMTLVELVIQKKPPKWTVSKMVSALGLLGVLRLVLVPRTVLADVYFAFAS